MNGGSCGDPATQNLLGLYVLGRLDQAEAESTRTHLVGCLSCRESLASLRSVAVALRLLRPTDMTDPANLAQVDPDGRLGAATAIPDGSPRRSPIEPTRCRFDLRMVVREQGRPRPLPSARKG
ncbi:anti-sigma factor family protein [Micromonospora sp. LOL_023]|uniref:anti-sigma factor family protein n=1 Tax=Micromonospora sp. LOL_023 TaxID=3345418 RepID=UPI003A87B044